MMKQIRGAPSMVMIGLATVFTATAFTATLFTATAFADDSEDHDPIRDAQRHKDCIAENVAKQDGRTRTAIRVDCDKAIADGSYNDPNISLDGMIKRPSPPPSQ